MLTDRLIALAHELATVGAFGEVTLVVEKARVATVRTTISRRYHEPSGEMVNVRLSTTEHEV